MPKITKKELEEDPLLKQWLLQNGIDPEKDFEPEEREAIYKDYQGARKQLDKQQSQADVLRNTAGPEGRMTGNVYTAANPLEFLGAAAKQGLGEYANRGIKKDNEKLNDQNALARQAYARELAKQVAGAGGPQGAPPPAPAPQTAGGAPGASPATLSPSAGPAPVPKPMPAQPGQPPLGANVPMTGYPNQQGPMRNAAPYQKPPNPVVMAGLEGAMGSPRTPTEAMRAEAIRKKKEEDEAMMSRFTQGAFM